MLYWILKRIVLGPILNMLFRPEVEGIEHIPEDGAAILASNHLSFSDSIFLPLVAPRRITFLAKSDYFTGTGVMGAIRRGFFVGSQAIPVDRHSSRAAQESLELALEVLKEGRAFGIYPEGTRSRDGRLYRGRTGVAWLALTAGVPVVPVGLVGARALGDEMIAKARAAGLDVVQDRCVKIEHARLFGGLGWVGVNTKVITAKRARQLPY